MWLVKGKEVRIVLSMNTDLGVLEAPFQPRVMLAHSEVRLRLVLRRVQWSVPERTKGLTPRRVVFLAPPASLHRLSRISPYWSEMIVRLGLIKIARIEAKAVGRSQFSMIDVTHVKATARATPSDGVVAHVHDRLRRQFGRNGRDGHRRRTSKDRYPRHEC
jgi:hypothetical protein